MVRLAMMRPTVSLLLLLALACHSTGAQPVPESLEYHAHSDLDTAAQEHHSEEHQDENAAPMPYSFEYSASDPEGSHSHSSTSDGKTVTGEYSIQLADGRMRTVKYTADENGYRAEIVTNELGTESKNPADVTIESSAPTGAEAALQGPPAPAAAAVPVEYLAADEPSVEAVPSEASASNLDHVYVRPPQDDLDHQHQSSHQRAEQQQQEQHRFHDGTHGTV